MRRNDGQGRPFVRDTGGAPDRWEVSAMEEVRLSPRERRILAEMERELAENGGRTPSTDAPGERPDRPSVPDGSRAPDGRDGTDASRGPARWRGPYRSPDRWAVRGTALLGAVALALLVSAVVTAAPVLTWVFAVVWVVALTCLLRMVIRWSRKMRTRT
ncbi:hypothetical protein ACWGIN_19860 [Streptomyces sp. NPDC054861]